MKDIQVQYFAMLREQAGCDKEKIKTPADTPAALYQELCHNHGFTLPAGGLKVAINDAFAAWNTTLKDGDSVVFIPPFAGG
jgi:molybdopterin converting factor subunit 1